MKKKVLKNGLTVALMQQPMAHSAAISIYIASGNRFETENVSGIAHFIEHMLFKGTLSRSYRDIAEESDIMGGQLNAYTSKEYTCIYSRALKEHVPKTLRLMCDMICNPLFDKKDIETEKGVILEEIGMYEDSPEDHCSDMLTTLCYKGRPLGFNILGTRETVSQMTAAKLREYMKMAYAPERIVVSLCGNFDENEVSDILEEYLGSLENMGNPLSYEKDSIDGGLTLCKRKIEQTQIAFCFNGLASNHPLKYAASFVSSVLGGASSSRLNRRIREELGLAYSVYTFSSSYLGTGVFGLFAGLAHKNQEKYLIEAADIIASVKNKITDEEIALTREQFKAGVALSNESLSAISASMGRQLLLDGEYVDLGETLKRIDNVSLSGIKEAAELITDPDVIALSVVGDAREEEFYNDILKKHFKKSK